MTINSEIVKTDVIKMKTENKVDLFSLVIPAKIGMNIRANDPAAPKLPISNPFGPSFDNLATSTNRDVCASG